MRIHVSLLVLCAGITACTTNVDPALVDTVTITSVPPSCAVRLNGSAIGRTPTTVTLDRNKNYEIQIGKGGYQAESQTLKPQLQSTSKGLEFGFPTKLNFSLLKVPGADDVKVPEGDEAEFKTLVKKVDGRPNTTSAALKQDAADAEEAIKKVKQALEAREQETKAKLAKIGEAIGKAKVQAATLVGNAAAEAKVTEGEIALKQAIEDSEAARKSADATIGSLESRRVALESQVEKVAAHEVAVQVAVVKADVEKALVAVENKIDAAQTALLNAQKARAALFGGKTPTERVAELEAEYSAEVKSLEAAHENANSLIKALSYRTEEVARLASNGLQDAHAETAKAIADAQKAAEDQKRATAEANRKYEDQLADLAKQIEAAKAAGEKALANAKSDAADAAAEINKKHESQVSDLNKQIEEVKAAGEKALANAKSDAADAAADANKKYNSQIADLTKQIEEAKAENMKSVAEARQKALDEANDKIKELTEKLANADKALATAKEESEAKLTEATKAAEKTLADARLDAEAKMAEAAKAAAEAKARIGKLAYSEFNARYALLENRLRAKQLTEDQFKQQLADLRKELGL